MTRDEILRLAREADPLGVDGRLYRLAELTPETIERFAALVAAHEREACAQIAQTPVYGEQDDLTMASKDRIAAAIRSRANV